MSVETIRKALMCVDTSHPNAPKDCAETVKEANEALDALVRALNAACNDMGADDASWYGKARKALGKEFEQW